MMFWIPLSIAIFSFLFFLLFCRRDEDRVNREWEELLQPKGKQLIELVQRNFGTGFEVADFHFGMAWQQKRLRNVDEAIHLLTIGYQAIEQFVPNLLMLISIMVRFSRMVAAITPLDTLDPDVYKTGQVTGLAYLHRWLHQLTRTVRESFRLRLFILSKGISITSKHLFEATHRVICRRSQDDREWEQIEAIRHDMGLLGRESIESFRWMMGAISSYSKSDLAEEFVKHSTGIHG